MKISRLGVVLTLIAGLVTVSARATTLSYKTIALTGVSGGDPRGPGLADGVEFTLASEPYLNGAGSVVFRSSVTGPGVDSSNDSTVYLHSGNILSLVVRESDAKPELPPGETIGGIAVPSLGEGSHVTYQTALVGAGVDNSNQFVLLSEVPGSLRIVARQGDVPPDVGPVAGFGNFIHQTSSNGDIALTSTMTGPGLNSANNRGLWAESGGNLHLVARYGTDGPAGPNFGAGVAFSEFNVFDAYAPGQVLFKATVTGTGIDTSNDQGLWQGGAGTLQAIVREGDAAAGLGGGIAHQTIATARANASGTIVFNGQLSGAVDSTNDSAIWAGDPGAFELVAREGGVAPETGGKVFGRLTLTRHRPLINAVGDVAFFGDLSDTPGGVATGAGIWSGPADDLHAVVLAGEVAPGTGGATFASFGTSPTNVLNDHGNVAFLAELAGDGITGDNNQGLWVTDGMDNLQLVVRTGDLFDVDEGAAVDNRTISQISFRSGVSADLPSYHSFNNRNQLVFLLNFTDGSAGIFTATVPEPAAAIFATMGLLTLSIFRCRRQQ